jgi:hypothetical protein
VQNKYTLLVDRKSVLQYNSYTVKQREYKMLATASEACKEFAANVGSEDTERAWILTPFDSWERNPYYCGPAVPHPEED